MIEKEYYTIPSSRDLQWMREFMALVVSLVITRLAAITLYMTFSSAKQIPGIDVPSSNVESLVKAQSEAYTRQKDIMLYALALFGTVTGYYLGRVPAEASARRAENTADRAQDQLSHAQDRLVTASTTASVAQTEAARASQERAKLKNTVNASRVALTEVRNKILSARQQTGGRATLGGKAIDDEGEPSELLTQAESRIDEILHLIDARQED